MTGVARHASRLKMTILTIWWLLRPNSTRAMTARIRASTWSDTCVIKLPVEEGAVNGVTGDAISRRIDVRWRYIVSAVARRRMATRCITTIGDAGVIEHCGAEGIIK